MKKITFMLLLATAFTYAQDVAPTFSWANKDSFKVGGETTNVTFKPGDVASVTLNYTLGSTGGVPNTKDFLLFVLQQEAPADKPVFSTWANGPAPNAVTAYPTATTGTAAGYTTTFTYTIPSTAQLSSAATDKTYRVLVYMAYKKAGTGTTVYGGVGASDPFIVKIRSQAEINTLGVNDFSQKTLTSFSPNPVTDSITFGADVETKNYTIYNMNGSEVLKQKATGSFDVSSLAKGVYILVTDAGTAKIVKE